MPTAVVPILGSNMRGQALLCAQAGHWGGRDRGNIQDFHANLETDQEMFFMLRMSPGACAEHMDGCATAYPVGCEEVMLRMCEWTRANQSLTSALPSPQEPSLNPKAILELPLESLAQKLQDGELSLESVLCSYLEEVGVGSGVGWGLSPVSSSQDVGAGVTSRHYRWLGRGCMPQSCSESGCWVTEYPTSGFNLSPLSGLPQCCSGPEGT